MRKKSFHTESSAAEPLRRRDLRWERLDNTAHLFPVIAGERMSGVYRICATLTEPITVAVEAWPDLRIMVR